MTIVYTAGPYSGGKHGGVSNEIRERNIQSAREVSAELWRKGFAVICPHLNTARFEDDYPDITYDQFIAGDLEIINAVDALVMLPGWEKSKGANIERAHALSLGIPVYVYPDVPEVV